MPERLPYFPCYAADLLVSTTPMSDEQLGAYTRLLLHAWIEEGLPTDLTAVRALGRWSQAAWSRIWPVVGSKWVEQGSRLVNPRQERERAKLMATLDRKSDAGKAGARKRWHSHASANGTANATAMRTQCHSESDPDPKQEPPVVPLKRGGRISRAERKTRHRLAEAGMVGDWREGCAARGHTGCGNPAQCELTSAIVAACPAGTCRRQSTCGLFSECREFVAANATRSPA
jgi:uncharacterized protein YdaU (DUF1376 family)